VDGAVDCRGGRLKELPIRAEVFGKEPSIAPAWVRWCACRHGDCAWPAEPHFEYTVNALCSDEPFDMLGADYKKWKLEMPQEICEMAVIRKRHFSVFPDQDSIGFDSRGDGAGSAASRRDFGRCQGATDLFLSNQRNTWLAAPKIKFWQTTSPSRKH
jgi:hypothetical protein